jgi:hypothetical protein
MAELGKILYFSNFEEKVRQKIFEARLNVVNTHNENFKKGEVSYEMDIYEYADRTRDEFVRLRTGLELPR